MLVAMFIGILNLNELQCALSTVLQVMLPKRLPGSLTAKERGWSLPCPGSRCFRTPSLPPPFFSLIFLSELHQAHWLPHLIPPPLLLVTSLSIATPSIHWLFSFIPATLTVFLQVLVLKDLFITYWLPARPHGYRRSCPRYRCAGQPTTGKNFYKKIQAKLFLWYKM